MRMQTPDLNRTIGGLAVLKVGYMGFPEAQQILDDGIALLKEREPVGPYVERDIDLESWYYGCGNCLFAIDYKDKFCRHCGRAVKWDAEST